MPGYLRFGHWVTLIAIVVFVVVMSLDVQDVFPDEPQTTETSATMRGIFTALATSYTYSLDMQFFQDRHNRETILAALRALVDNTGALETHGGGLDPSFEYLRHSLADDAYQALERFEQRQHLGSQFMLNKMMENCATCHARLPSDERFDTGAQFLKDARIDAIPPIERINIEIATRQFDRAMATYEEIFELPTMTAERLLLIGAFEGYLKLCIGVVDDFERPIRTFETFMERNDMPMELKKQIAGWIDELWVLDLTSGPGDELATAQSLIGDASVLNRPPSDRSRLVGMVAANSILHRYMRSLSTYDESASEAFFLMAVTESYISRSPWISETDFLLEQAVRSAPKSEHAGRALGVLEERSKRERPVGAYEGSEPRRVDLEELKKLVEG